MQVGHEKQTSTNGKWRLWYGLGIINMKSYLTLILSFLFLLTAKAQSALFDIVIKDISILDSKRQLIIPHRTIYINGNRIVKIGSTKKLKRGTAKTIIDGKGKFISPGFWDMHIHTCWKDNLDESVFPVLLSYGITGVRDMGGSLTILDSFRQKAKNNPASYPNLFGAGPILDGENPVHPEFSIPMTSYNVKGVLDSLYKNGADFFKVYSLLQKNVLDSIIIYSEKKNIPFSGHVSEYITAEEGVKMGQKSIEHLNRLEDLGADSNRLTEFIRLARMHNTWICPTLIIYKRKYEILNGQFYYNDLYETLDNDLKFEWEQVKKKRQNRKISDEETKNGNTRFINQKNLVKTFYINKIAFLLGADFAGMQFIYPGYSYHEEMELLSSLGISNFDILKMATYNPAVFLGIDELYGTVEVNKMADLVLFGRNPVENIKYSQKIDLVIKAGKIVGRN